MNLEMLNAELSTCRKCSRLVAWREQVACQKRRAFKDQDYWGRPVPGFGDPRARVFLVGLAPGAHGSNRTGRQFTGDASGDFLFPALFRAGFASQPQSLSRGDGLVLRDLYTAPVCRCAPPDNKPSPQEMVNCRPYLQQEVEIIQPRVFVALGRIAFGAVLSLFSLKKGDFTFSHASMQAFAGDKFLVCSYHPSRQNTQTGRLSVEMFDQVWARVRGLLDG